VIAPQDCQLCPRLAAYRIEQKSRHPDYHCQPVAGFGDEGSRLLIVGLAPGLHGANATGRPFTGDASGQMLFEMLFRYGFASKPDARSSHDDMRLFDCRITNAVKCLPPNNRPNGDEISCCNAYLRSEIANLKPAAVILALGAIAHRAILKALDLPPSRYRFGHLAEYGLPGGLVFIDSYHCSRYNINTGRLDRNMLENVFDRVTELLR